MKNAAYFNQEFLDYGAKLEFQFKKLSLSYEYIKRKNDLVDMYRSNGLLKYNVSEKITLTGAFGKNFGDKNNLISLLGINWGFSTGQEKALVKDL